MSNLEWQHDLTLAIASTLNALRGDVGDDPLAMLAVDCHPWNGGLFLAALTRSELEADPTLADPAEMASWQHYHFGESRSEWNVASLCEKMKTDYYSTDNHDTIAQQYFRSCAAAVADQRVASALRVFTIDSSFRVSVIHPDDGTEYCG